MTMLRLAPRFQVFLHTLAFAAMVAVNALANILPINGLTTGEVSARYTNLFVPAGMTFSIWGIIYLLLAASLVYQVYVGLLKDVRRRDFLARIGPWFVLSCVANMSWIWAWHHEQLGLSMALMLVLLVALLSMYLRLGVGQRVVRPAEKMWVHVPVSVYLGWICIATIANASAWLTSLGWDGGPLAPGGWTALLLLVGGGMALAFLRWRHDAFLALTMGWGLAGIWLRRIGEEDGILDPLGLLAGGIVLCLLAGTLMLVRLRESAPADLE